jgi:MFS family permease
MTYRQLISQNKILKKIIAIQLVAYFGAWFSSVAIYTMLVDFGASAFLISLITATHFLPAIVFAPFIGGLIDRVKAKKLMLILLTIELIMTLCFLFIDSLDDVYLLFIFLFIRMSSASIFFTTEMTLFPKIIDGDALTKMNELHSIIWSLTFTLGVAISGIVVNIYGIELSFIIDALFFVIAILILLFTNLDEKTQELKTKFFKSIKDGFGYIRKNTFLIKLIFLHASVGLLTFDAIVTLLAGSIYKYTIAVPLAIGLTHAFRALGIMIGPMVLTNWINKERLFYLFIFQGFAVILWAVLQYNFYFGLVSMFIMGFSTSIIWSYTYSILQNKIQEEYIGRVLAYNEMIYMFTSAVTTMSIGIFAPILQLSTISIIFGFCMMLAGLYYKKNLKLM